MPSPLATDTMQVSPLAAQNAPAPPLNIWQQAQQQYPILAQQNYGYVENFAQGRGFLEHWAPGEPGAPESGMRPAQLPLNQPGIEIYDSKTRPIDVLGDIVSHNLVNTDPKIKQVYTAFQQSLTPDQHRLLQEQYEYARQNEGENRPFEQWKNAAGLPGLFRGYAFDQWPKEFTDKVYTPEQKQLFDGMMNYLRGGQ